MSTNVETKPAEVVIPLVTGETGTVLEEVDLVELRGTSSLVRFPPTGWRSGVEIGKVTTNDRTTETDDIDLSSDRVTDDDVSLVIKGNWQIKSKNYGEDKK